MKVAINKCFGGFTLSDEVHEKLIKLGVPFYENWDQIPKNNNPYVIKSDNPSDAFGKYYSNFNDYDKRTHPLLIKAIEQSSNPSGRFGLIKIIEIPDNTDFHIDNYDGIESIHEVHKSWG